MKKFLLGTMAALIAVGPIAAAPLAAQDWHHDQRGDDRGHDRGYDRGYQQGQRQGYRQWRRGERFDTRYAQNYSRIDNWRAYRGRRLYAPPRGYYWARSGNDAVLVAAAGGLIGAVLAGAFN